MILLDKTVSVHRLTDIDSNKSSFSTFTLDQDAAIQPAGDTKSGGGVGNYDKLYKIYMDVDTDIQEGDKIKDSDGNIYLIESGGIENRDDGLIADHLELIVKKVNG